MTLRCADTHVCEVSIRSADRRTLVDLLSDPQATMEALLDRKKLTSLPGHRFRYQSSPYRILNFSLQPEVVFAAVWNGQQLEIDFEHCEIHGLGAIQKALVFGCKATLTPFDALIRASASAELVLASRQSFLILPDSLLLSVGRKSLDLVFARLERRCQKRLRKAVMQSL